MPTKTTTTKTAAKKAPTQSQIRRANSKAIGDALSAPLKPRKATAKAPARKAKAVTPEALAAAGAEVARIRSLLDIAVQDRNALMVQAKGQGMSVAAIGRAAGFASTGGAQVAIASVEG